MERYVPPSATSGGDTELVDLPLAEGCPARDNSSATRTKKGPHTLFCFMLIVPWGYEQSLVRWQYAKCKGIFSCDLSDVYSNVTIDLGFENKIVNHSLEAPIGGQWNTRLNTWIFAALWRQVFLDGTFNQASWSVKVDPDAVFLPQRLHDVVSNAAHSKCQHGAGCFSNNCEYTGSLHGPIELFSHRAVAVYGAHGAKICLSTPQDNWGQKYDSMAAEWQQEDVWIRKCMIGLGTVELDDFSLLAESSCHWDWQSCQGDHVVFHPFKTIDKFQACQLSMEQSGKWTTPKTKVSHRP